MFVGRMSCCGGFLHLVAECGVSVNESQDVAVDAAARRELGKDSRLHLLLPLLDDHLTGLPLPHNLLVALADLRVDLNRKKRQSYVAFQIKRQIKTVWTCITHVVEAYICLHFHNVPVM